MILPVALLAAQVAAPAPTAVPPVADDIIVVARKQTCDVRFADRAMSDAEFRHHAREWAAGVPVRVIALRSADLKCLSKIAFRLADRGVKRIQFVAPGDLALPRPTGPQPDPFPMAH